MSETPHPAADGAAKITFGALWKEADNQRTRYRIWADELRRQAIDQKPESLRSHILDAAAERDGLVAIYDAMARLIERVRDDGAILDRLRAIAAEEAVAALPVDAPDESADG